MAINQIIFFFTWLFISEWKLDLYFWSKQANLTYKLENKHEGLPYELPFQIRTNFYGNNWSELWNSSTLRLFPQKSSPCAGHPAQYSWYSSAHPSFIHHQTPPMFPYSLIQSELRNLEKIFGFEDVLTMTAGSVVWERAKRSSLGGVYFMGHICLPDERKKQKCFVNVW